MADLERYFKELGKLPVLTTKENNQLAIEAKTSQRAKNELTKGNLRYVIAVAKNFYGQGLDMNELIAEGNVGLIRSVDKFNPEKDENFIKCAGWWIRQSIMYALSNNRTVRKPMNKIQEWKEDNGSYEREKMSALDAPISRDGQEGATLGDLIAADIDERADNYEHKAFLIKQGIKGLDVRSRDIILKRYGVGLEYRLTVKSIADEYDMTEANVNKILREGLKKMARRLDRLNLEN